MNARLQHVENMVVRQAEIDKGDTRWYVTTANGFKISDGFVARGDAELHLAWRRHQAEQDPED